MKLERDHRDGARRLPGFADMHPFAPIDTTPGYLSLIDELEEWLARVTGYAKVSVQPQPPAARESWRAPRHRGVSPITG